MIEELYSRRSNLMIGFHGCDRLIAEKVINGEFDLKKSENEYDWLGHGVYFWENNQTRAMQFIEEVQKRNPAIVEPAIVGAIIDLGFCLDLTDSLYFDEIKEAYHTTLALCKETGVPLPENKSIANSTDLLLRNLD